MRNSGPIEIFFVAHSRCLIFLPIESLRVRPSNDTMSRIPGPKSIHSKNVPGRFTDAAGCSQSCHGHGPCGKSCSLIPPAHPPVLRGINHGTACGELLSPENYWDLSQPKQRDNHGNWRARMKRNLLQATFPIRRWGWWAFLISLFLHRHNCNFYIAFDIKICRALVSARGRCFMVATTARGIQTKAQHMFVKVGCEPILGQTCLQHGSELQRSPRPCWANSGNQPSLNIPWCFFTRDLGLYFVANWPVLVPCSGLISDNLINELGFPDQPHQFSLAAVWQAALAQARHVQHKVNLCFY